MILIMSSISFPSALLTTTTSTLPLTILETKDHNPNSFTQGWVQDEDTFYESSGLYGQSFINRYNHNSKTVSYLPYRYFAEGLTLLNDTLYLLTWKEETLLLIDKHTLKITNTLPYKGEGWGLTHNDQQLIMSNGSSTLFFRNPKDFTITQRLEIQHLDNINELEYIEGIIWANCWNDDHIYAINPRLSCVVGKIDLFSLRAKTLTPNNSNVLNGLAYDKAKNGLWVTGKRWPKRYLIALPSTISLREKACL